MLALRKKSTEVTVIHMASLAILTNVESLSRSQMQENQVVRGGILLELGVDQPLLR